MVKRKTRKENSKLFDLTLKWLKVATKTKWKRP